jgi:hypothetical protein
MTIGANSILIKASALMVLVAADPLAITVSRAAEPIRDAAVVLAQTSPTTDGSQTPRDRTKSPTDKKDSEIEPKKRGRFSDPTMRRLGESISMCEVTPPCPEGCREDLRNNICVDNPPP